MTLIEIHQGDADTLTETITGLSSLSGYTAKLYIYTQGGTEVDTITGTISGLTVTYQILNEDSKAYTLGTHIFETKLFDSSDHVYTPLTGTFLVTKPLKNDPS
jgi:hypothetical protein